VYREVERTGPHHDPQFGWQWICRGLSLPKASAAANGRRKVARSVMIEREGVGGGK